MSATIDFASSARQAWRRPASPVAIGRALARSAALSIAGPFMQPGTDFIRCLYGHAVFPEHQLKFRSWIRSLKNIGEFISTPTLVALMNERKPQRGRYFHLSFDDGFANVATVGGPVL